MLVSSCNSCSSLESIREAGTTERHLLFISICCSNIQQLSQHWLGIQRFRNQARQKAKWSSLFQMHSPTINKILKGNMKKKLSVGFNGGYNFTFFASSQIFNMIVIHHFENNMYNALTMVVRMVKGCFPLKPLFWGFYKLKIIACLDDLFLGMFSMPRLFLFFDWRRGLIKVNVSGFELSEWEKKWQFHALEKTLRCLFAPSTAKWLNFIFKFVTHRRVITF